MKKKLILAAAGLLSVMTFAACSSTNDDIATMKGGSITVQDFYDEAKTDSTNQSIVQRMIIYKVFDDKYGDEVSDKKVNAEYKKQKEQFGDTFESQLSAAGYTPETFKTYIKNNLVLEAGLKDHIEITKADLKTAWESYHPEVEAQIIKLDSEDDAKDVKKSADDGDDFSDLAKDNSTDDATKDDGGTIKFDSTSTDVPDEVKEAAFDLKNGEISDIVTSTDASTYTTSYYIVKMVKTSDKGDDMDKYKDELTKIARETKLADSTFTTQVIAEELEDANVKIKDDSFSSVLSSFTTTSSSSDSSTADSSTESTTTTTTEDSSSTDSSSTDSTSTSATDSSESSTDASSN
ncbi:MAG: peptidylprolyl isomerase [Enterococcus sp.]